MLWDNNNNNNNIPRSSYLKDMQVTVVYKSTFMLKMITHFVGPQNSLLGSPYI